MATLGQYADRLGSMSEQEIFEVGVEHLLSQGVQSVQSEDGWNCSYIGDGGITCAAGPFVKPEKARTLPWDPYGDVRHTDNGFDVICHLQCIHDSCEPQDWLRELIELGSGRKLDNSFISGLKIHPNCRGLTWAELR